MNSVSKVGRKSIMKKLLRYDKEKTFAFIDCETFNLCLNFCHNLPWQISMLKVNGDNISSSKDFYIKWDTHLKIGAEAARITRYSQQTMDKKGVAPEDVYPTIKDWLDNADYIVGHNILGFDIYLIKGLYEYMGDDYSHLTAKVIDTNCIAKGMLTEKKYHKKDNFLEYQYQHHHYLTVLLHERKICTNRIHLVLYLEDIMLYHNYFSYYQEHRM